MADASKEKPPLQQGSPSVASRAKLWKSALPAILLAASVAGILLAGSEHPTPMIAYTELYALIGEGKVAKLTLTGPDVTGTLKQDEKVGTVTLRTFQSELPQQEDRDLLPLLREQKVAVEVTRERTSLFAQAASSFLPWLLIMGGWFWLSRRTQKGGSGGIMSLGLPRVLSYWRRPGARQRSPTRRGA